MSTEPFGTTPLPTCVSGSPVKVWFDVNPLLARAQQPQTQQVANFEALSNEACINGCLLDVNQHFIVYGIKNGLIRVFQRHTVLRSLLRGHEGQNLTDMHFFQNGDVLASAASNAQSSTVLVWRVFGRSPEIMSEKLLEISTPHFTIQRVVWHPFNPNQFWMLHTNAANHMVATLVETTRIATQPHPVEGHAVCNFHDAHIIMDGAVQISADCASGSGASLTDLTWSNRDTRHILTCHDSGEIVLWDLKTLSSSSATPGTVTPARLATLRMDEPVSRGLFLPHEDVLVSDNRSQEAKLTTCFVTASDKNGTITVWSPFESSGALPQKIQILAVENPSPSYVLDVCSGPAPVNASPPSAFVVMADRHSGAILAWHLRADWNDTVPKKALLTGCDYVVPFLTKFPTYSWSVVCAPATNISDEELSDQGGLVFDVELFAYQTTAVQRLKLTSYMCLPPENSWTDPTPSVRLERLVSAQSAHVSEIGSDDANPDVEFDEAYDLEEDDEEEEIEAPDPSSLPSPLGIGNSTPSLSNNPFANWLGAIASKTTTSVPPAVVAAPAPVPPPASSLPTPPPDQPKKNVLSKDDLEDKKKVEPQNAAPVMTTKGPNNFSNADSKKKKKVKATPVPPSAPEVGKVSILRRDDEVKPSLLLDSGANIPPSPTNPIEASMDTKSIAEDIRKVVHHEMRSTLVPALKQAVQESLNTSVINPIQASITQLSKQVVMNDNMESALSGSVEEPLQAAVANTMRTVLIPTMESITNQVFVQVSESLERTAATTSTGSKKELEAISLQLTTMTALVAELTNEVQSLRKLVRSNQAPVPPAPTAPSLPPINPVEALRKEIAALIQQRQYEAAFTKAVSSSTAELAVFACTNSNLTSVLGSARVELSQRILICLMQQLSTVLNWRDASLNVPLILEWLQEIALSLDPNDDTIKRHIPTVLQQMVSSVNNRMSLDEPVLRRPLQKLLQILRGMSIS